MVDELIDDQSLRRGRGFFATLKTERTDRRRYNTRDEARADVFNCIEQFYNPRRRHLTLGYLSPAECERANGH